MRVLCQRWSPILVFYFGSSVERFKKASFIMQRRHEITLREGTALIILCDTHIQTKKATKISEM